MKSFAEKRTGISSCDAEHCALLFIRAVMLLTVAAIVAGWVL